MSRQTGYSFGLVDDWRLYDTVAEDYERSLAQRTLVPGRDLIALAEPAPGARVLDVGTGTGVVARAAEEIVGPDAVVVGVDTSLGMLTAGLSARPGLRLAVAEAIDLPFRDGSFDLVLANFVVSHFTKYETALFDMIRILRRGGRLAVSAWGPSNDEFMRTWRELAEGVAGRALLADALNRAMPWEERFADRARMQETLRDAGLRPVRVEAREYRFQMSLEDYVVGRETAATGRFLREMLGAAGWESFRRRVRETFRERFPDPLTDFRDVVLAVGTKP
jgi:ubiquinone/menaquinone biosynthesis C-methylase UbiE